MNLTDDHRAALQDILQWRRDVRHFRTDPVAPAVLTRLQSAMDLAPSVGNARPWRVRQIQSPDLRAAVIANFETANAEAATHYTGTKRAAYDQLKLAGLRDAPVHLAVFTETDPTTGHGLGRRTMPEMLNYSTVAAVHTLWLAARAENIGMGWVSILDPKALHATLGTPESWSLTAYLCLGHPKTQDDTPLLHRSDWQENTATHWQKI